MGTVLQGAPRLVPAVRRPPLAGLVLSAQTMTLATTMSTWAPSRAALLACATTKALCTRASGWSWCGSRPTHTMRMPSGWRIWRGSR